MVNSVSPDRVVGGVDDAVQVVIAGCGAAQLRDEGRRVLGIYTAIDIEIELPGW